MSETKTEAEPNVLGDLLRETAAEIAAEDALTPADELTAADDLFESKAKAPSGKSSKGSSKKTAPKPAATPAPTADDGQAATVRAAVAALDGDYANTAVATDDDSDAPITAARLAPIKRPGGIEYRPRPIGS